MTVEKDAAAASVAPGLLAGKSAVVFGGGGGIGEATSRVLAASGASVAIVDFDAEAASKLAKELEASGAQAVAIQADFREEAGVNRAIGEADAALGGFDILANVAGGMSKHAPWKYLEEWDTATFDSIVQINFRYVFWSCRAATPVLKKRGGGAIVNVASVAGLFASPDQAPYGAAKAALISMTKTLAVELGPDRIRVNAVSPGVTMTAVAQDVMPQQVKDAIVGVTPLARLGRPEDIANGILFFSSPLAEFVTGHVLPIEGGVGINFPYPKLHS